jgi:ribA/ribD-fused uncharacterized protein
MSIYFYKLYNNDGYLNNLYPSPFTVDGINFINVEQYFVWRKVMLFDPELEPLILSTKDSKEMQKIAVSVKNYKDAEWLAKRYDIMKEGLYHKFSQNPTLQNKLMWIGNSGIVNADPKDLIWGIGITAVEALMNVPWRGENLLGEALIEVRSMFPPVFIY